MWKEVEAFMEGKVRRSVLRDIERNARASCPDKEVWARLTLHTRLSIVQAMDSRVGNFLDLAIKAEELGLVETWTLFAAHSYKCDFDFPSLWAYFYMEYLSE
jgi:hypothetical protein